MSEGRLCTRCAAVENVLSSTYTTSRISESCRDNQNRPPHCRALPRHFVRSVNSKARHVLHDSTMLVRPVGLLLSLSTARSSLGFTSSGRYIFRRSAPSSSSALKMTAATPSQSGDLLQQYSSKSMPTPPVPRREEDRHVLAGKLAPTDVGYADSKGKPLVRQSDSSTETLLDPPVTVSDPYGWMRDEDLTGSIDSSARRE